jgi:hypothetical protein
MAGLDIKEVRTMQTGDINKLSDNVYFIGCSKQCMYCFNPELQNTRGGCNAIISDVIRALSDCEWVCLMGGEPIEQNLLEVQRLIDNLRWNLDKKVCVFSSYSDPWNVIEADHYHVHINNIIPEPYPPDNVSYGYVSYYLTTEKMDEKLGSVSRFVPIYVKTCYGYEEASNVDSNALYISSVLGFTKVEINGVIKVE